MPVYPNRAVKSSEGSDFFKRMKEINHFANLAVRRGSRERPALTDEVQNWPVYKIIDWKTAVGLFDEIRLKNDKETFLSPGIRTLVYAHDSGSCALYLAEYLKHYKFTDFHITYTEISPTLREDCRRIKDELNIEHVFFSERDGIALKEGDLGDYNLVIIIKPFNTNFDARMDEFLPMLHPDTVLVTCMFGDKVTVLKPEKGVFERILSPLYQTHSDQQFGVHRRIGKQPDA
jgi:hypothetical protein